MPNLIRKRRVHEVWKKPGELVQIPCNGWTFPPGLYRGPRYQIQDQMRNNTVL